MFQLKIYFFQWISVEMHIRKCCRTNVNIAPIWKANRSRFANTVWIETLCGKPVYKLYSLFFIFHLYFKISTPKAEAFNSKLTAGMCIGAHTCSVKWFGTANLVWKRLKQKWQQQNQQTKERKKKMKKKK